VQAILSDAAIPANNKLVLQLDYSNAFNTLDRSHLFKKVRAQLPGLSAFVEWSYGSRPFLFFGDSIILSETGLQQGYPLGPLLFAIGLHPLVLRIQEQAPKLFINGWYLDDGYGVGGPADILKVLNIILKMSPQLGLHPNLRKTVFWRDRSFRDQPPPGFDPTPLGIPECLADGVLVLGAPAGSPAYCENEVPTRVSKVATLLDSLASL
jgi:hypothetical protein